MAEGTCPENRRCESIRRFESYAIRNATIAQLVEQLTCTQLVVRSIRTGGYRRVIHMNIQIAYANNVAD